MLAMLRRWEISGMRVCWHVVGIISVRWIWTGAILWVRRTLWPVGSRHSLAIGRMLIIRTLATIRSIARRKSRAGGTSSTIP